MSFTSITVSGTYKDEAGSALSGSVSFLLSDTLSDGSGDVRTPVLILANLDANGSFSTTLVATDDPTTQPSGATYRVVEKIDGRTRLYNIVVPHNSPGAALNLAAVAHALAGSASFTYALSGDVNRVATYDISFSAQGTIAAGATVLKFVSVRNWQIPQNFASSQGVCGTNPTSTATFAVNKNGAPIGQIVVATNGAISFIMAKATNFASGDVLTVTGPSPADATLADVSFTLLGAAL